MKPERLNPSQLAMPGGDESDIRAFIESDFKIRSGLCPNDCGLMTEDNYGQGCNTCGFSCNTKAQKDIQ